MRKKLAVGNWKMNGTMDALSEIRALIDLHPDSTAKTVICPPATLIASAVSVAGESAIEIGAQDCHSKTNGAHTGDISAQMLIDAGATYVILGHSERRSDHREDNTLVREKARAAHTAGLTAIICVGESLDQREAANTLDIIGAQLALSVPDTATNENTVIAYEPIWAIGTGLTPTLEQIGEVHNFMCDRLADRFGGEIGGSISLLYGGSVKPGNAAEIFAVPNVDGALVGGASLKHGDFLPIINALESTL